LNTITAPEVNYLVSKGIYGNFRDCNQVNLPCYGTVVMVSDQHNNCALAVGRLTFGCEHISKCVYQIFIYHNTFFICRDTFAGLTGHQIVDGTIQSSMSNYRQNNSHTAVVNLLCLGITSARAISSVTLTDNFRRYHPTCYRHWYCLL